MKQDMDGTAKSFWQSAGYVSWFTADTASAVGAALRALAISLLGYAVSGSTIAAGWLGTSSMIAQQVASVFGGTFVDRHDRKRLIVANSVVGVLAWGAIAVLLLCGALSFPVLLLIAVLASGINGFLGSATDAMLRSIIDIRYYPKARSLNEGRDATIAMAGSPIGGFLYSIAPWLPFLASACMYAVAGVAATGIREYGSDGGRIGETDGDAVKGGFFRDFLEGWSCSSWRHWSISASTASNMPSSCIWCRAGPMRPSSDSSVAAYR
ncbi:MFS transporter [Bifidobacterium adolescentis]|uniref:MFS transporter n=1 Tax=Bifidobacterium adolescentis TaxID=1680 RepID=UPI00398CEC4D